MARCNTFCLSLLLLLAFLALSLALNQPDLTLDSDGDGLYDHVNDMDDDNDGIMDIHDEDDDGDGIVDTQDSDWVGKHFEMWSQDSKLADWNQMEDLGIYLRDSDTNCHK